MKTCKFFPNETCDGMCQTVGCGMQGAVIKMRSDGVPESEISDENYWQAKYERLNLSLAKNKRLFSDEYSQSVIESQVKRIKRLEDDLSRANCELDKLRKKNPASGVLAG